MPDTIYDLIIIGAGPAGLTASIYASCFNLKHLIIGKIVGGQMMWAPDVLNYPGFKEITGPDLTNHMVEQVKMRGGELVIESVTKLSTFNPPAGGSNSEESGFAVETETGKKFQTRSLILATGTERKKLGIPGEIEYTAKGVMYCAICEKLDYEGKVTVIVGGGNSAAQAAVEVAEFASKVYILYRGSELRGDPIWLDQLKANPKIEVLYNTVVKEIKGDGTKVTEVIAESSLPAQTGNPPAGRPVKEKKELKTDKVFIEIGGVPGTALVIPLGVNMDPGGYIRVDERLATNVAGIFAAGDLVSYGLSIEQISSAVGLGARASSSVYAYLKNDKAPSLWGKAQIKR